MPPSAAANRPQRLAAVYEALVARPNSTVSALVRETKLSRPTITTVLESLTGLRLITPRARKTASAAPPKHGPHATARAW